ncbi:hypothetical protein [Acetivibrio ethanolgignens]|uniref:Uncharacterized protein n=1 Tax=Acetivibrio ethanolgignens TaxID=290052 RepID=A0A0V8QHY2_9FIRM|nr:hypothetical protein [Acetivibrio ethanolgignens]KSV60003.1 hypothetical protein ASU35_06920 [Acetivibrio ethanolgignens]
MAFLRVVFLACSQNEDQCFGVADEAKRVYNYIEKAFVRAIRKQSGKSQPHGFLFALAINNQQQKEEPRNET